MQIYNGVKELLREHPAGLKGSVITIGNFDGVHRGHQVLLEILKEQAEQAKVPAVVMTFQPHPMKILAPDKEILRLFSLEDQAEQLKNLGVQFLIREPFDHDLAKTTADDFLENYLCKPLHPKVFVVGHDLHFGKGRVGNAAFLKAKTEKNGFQVVQVPAYQIHQKIVSSSRIRELLTIPDLAAVHELLGRNYNVEGLVEAGDARGEKLGFPTANLRPPAGWLLPKGVYITSVSHQGTKYSSITNVGVNPTFEDPTRPLRVESFIFDLNKNIYGEKIKVEFCKFLRNEKKFNNAQELVAQIQMDIKQAKEYWHGSA